MALKNREMQATPPRDVKWWEIREKLRIALEKRGWEPFEIQEVLGKNIEEFQRMNELRTEIGMEPISGPYAIPHMLGKLDVGLAATGAGGFTKTLGQGALPYLGMMGESVLAGTDVGRGIKEWPEDQPKDWRYALMLAGLPLSALGGTMAGRQLASKIPPAPAPKGIQTLKSPSEKRTGAIYSGTKRILSEEEALEKSNRFVNIKSEGRSFGAHKKGGETNWFIDPETKELFKWSGSRRSSIPRGFHLVRSSGYDPVRRENFIPKFVRKAQKEFRTPGQIDETRRKILKGAAAGTALAAIPGGLKTISKVGPTAAKVGTAAGKVSTGSIGTIFSRIPIEYQHGSMKTMVDQWKIKYQRYDQPNPKFWRGVDKTQEETYTKYTKPFFKKYGLKDEDVMPMEAYAGETRAPSGPKDNLLTDESEWFSSSKGAPIWENVDELRKAGKLTNNPYAFAGKTDVGTLWDESLDVAQYGSKVNMPEGVTTFVDDIKFIKTEKLHGKETLLKEGGVDIPLGYAKGTNVEVDFFEYKGIPIVRERYVINELGEHYDDAYIYFPNDEGMWKLIK